MGESQWVLQELRSNREHFDRRLDSIDERLRETEKTISTYKGWGLAAVALLVLLQVLLRIFEVDITPR